MKSILIISLSFFIPFGATSAAPFQGSGGPAKGARGDTPDKTSQKTNVVFAKRALQGFDMRVWISNQMTMGLEAWDCGVSGNCIPEDPPYGLEYPAGSGMEHLYGGGPAIAGKVDGVRRVSEGYNLNNRTKNLLPDPAHPLRERIWRTSVADSATEPNRRGCDDDGDGLIDEDDLDGLDNDGDWSAATDDVGTDGIPDQMETGCWGGYDAATNPDPNFDNYDLSTSDYCRPLPGGVYRRKNDPDIYTEKNGIPDHGEPHVDEDYAAISDNDLYCSASDMNAVASGQFPLGIRVLQKSYAWRSQELNAIIPFDYYFINTSEKTITDVYVGFFVDMDIGPVSIGGYNERNYTCYIDSLTTAYIHNPVDRGATPLGITVLGTSKPLSELKFIYQWFNFGARNIPNQDDSTLYSYMSGEPYADDLVATCDSPNNPSDVWFMLSFGPFEAFAPGDTLKISIALVGGEGVDEGPNNLTANAQTAVKLLRRGFVNPVVPPSPSLKTTEGFQQITLEWGAAAGPIDPLRTWDDSNKLAQSYPPDHWRRINPPCDESGGSTGCAGGRDCNAPESIRGGRTFEGYRLYRSEDPGDAPELKNFSLVKQFDIDDGINFDIGLDTVYVDSNLVRGKRYWYSVTSFGIPDITVVDRVGADGEIIRDTLFTPGPESALSENMVRVDLSFAASDEADKVLVVPNPYRVDMDYTYESGGWEGRGRDWNETKRQVKFIHLPRKCTIRVFSLTGDHITTIEYESPESQPNRGELEWDLLSESNRALASGVYVYTVESLFGKQIGKFVLIR